MVTDLERRIAAIPLERYRNFCIVAHVDHGKSTLSDRLLELTGTITPGGNKQVLDKLDVERERGITVKAQTCTMIFNYKGDDYLLHLVDTPGYGGHYRPFALVGLLLICLQACRLSRRSVEELCKLWRCHHPS